MRDDRMLFRLEGVLVSYQTALSGHAEVTGLDRLNGTVFEGDFVWLSGPNGSGKTTLLGVLAGRVVTDSGLCVLGDGRSIKPEGLPRHFSVCTVFQNLAAGIVPGLTVADHLAMRALMLKRATSRTQATAAAGRFITAHPVLRELSARKQDGAHELSGGWQQVLQVAAGLFARPDVLLLDEPTSHCSPATKADLEAFIARSVSARLVVYISHERPGPEIMGRVTKSWTLRQGQLSEEA